MAAYVRKTEDYYDIVYNYGVGLGKEVIDRTSTYKEAKQSVRSYIENEGIHPEIVKRREKIEKS